MMRVFALSFAVFVLIACGGNRRSGAGAASTATSSANNSASAKTENATQASAKTAFAAHDNLNAVLFMQTAAEYAALCRQAYAAATLALDGALASPNFSADLAQQARGQFAGSPPAVIVDIDETVLDNSAYQAQLIRDQQVYSLETWQAWTAKAQAKAVPGAVDFIKAAEARGMTVFYVTNRRATEEPTTRRNLAALGLKLDERNDVILSRDERADWKSSDKTARRAEVARKHRIVLLVGDNLGDFLEPGKTIDERAAAVSQHAELWGKRWIMLPNPSYGDWEQAIISADRPLNAEQARARKAERLRF